MTWLQPYPDRWLEVAGDSAAGPLASHNGREAVALAFIVALQLLPPRQTAAVVLCDVLDFSVAEVAETLNLTPTTVKGLLQRGRASLKRQRVAVDQAPPPRSPSEAKLARRFAEAFSADDVEAVVTLLSDDAWLAMPPAPHEYHGAQAIAAFLRASPSGVIVLTLRGDRIAGITRFLDSRLPSMFGLQRGAGRSYRHSPAPLR